ncbi:unnamed protein product [Trichogramma brassicae]|uniref:60S ribosomal protein L6 n=1 Tax=Trichogramma brassicae TaxID=86971 RepID=A0A6H5IZL8_9HYME|nr:unnamed protein product [Trichogramma brassicae]
MEKAAVTKPQEGKKAQGKPRNYDLGNGINRFSRARMFHKKVVEKKPVTVEKQIGGEKNGQTRTVLLKKRRSSYPTADLIKKRPSKKCFSQHVRHLRASIVPGTILILLAGPHKGKRVVFMKQLKSGLLLVNGPFLINGCPLRRIHQNYVIATSTKIDMSGVKLPENLNDEYFKRVHEKRAKKEEGDIFAVKKTKYVPSAQRKVDQKLVDSMIVDAIKKSGEKKTMFAYLATMFGLRSSQYPHRMKF